MDTDEDESVDEVRVGLSVGKAATTPTIRGSNAGSCTTTVTVSPGRDGKIVVVMAAVPVYQYDVIVVYCIGGSEEV